MSGSEVNGFVVLYQPNQAESLFEIADRPITIGRSSQNDIVLNSGRVSKRHAVIRYDENGWRVADLGSTNGTTLNGRQLPAHKAFTWRLGQTLRIDRFELALRPNPLAASPLGSSEQRLQTPGPVLGQTDEPITRPPATVPAPIAAPAPRPAASLQLSEAALLLAPGESRNLAVTVRNEGDLPFCGALAQTGLPFTWVTMPHRQLNLATGQSCQVTMAIHPPAVSLTQPGSYILKLDLITAAGLSLATEAVQLEVTATGRFQSQLKPARLSTNGEGRLLIKNGGQTPGCYQLELADEQNRLRLQQPAGPVELGAGERTVVAYQIQPRRRPLLGRRETLPFTLTVRGNQGQQHHQGTIQIQPVAPAWALPLAALLVVMFLLVGLLAINSWELFQEQIVASLAGLLGGGEEMLSLAARLGLPAL
jgi:pSer/pThr/pTyr-binding forkhead associated (FHA) protein